MRHSRPARDPQNYIDRIRNPLKRDYAMSFYAYLRNGGIAPVRPEGLSFMAAQAVEIQLRELFQGLH